MCCLFAVVAEGGDVGGFFCGDGDGAVLAVGNLKRCADDEKGGKKKKKL